jgi:hypothetical protein
MSGESRLYPAVLFCLFCGVLGVAAAAWGWREAGAARDARDRNAARSLALQAEQTRLREEEAESRQLEQRFREIQAGGFFGRENRLEQVERLREARRREAIPVMHYKFQPQQPLEEGDAYFLTSVMSLSLGLNHEMELDAFLQTLTARGRVLARVRECDMRRNPDRPHPPRPGPNILTQCSLDWITGHLPEDIAP